MDICTASAPCTSSSLTTKSIEQNQIQLQQQQQQQQQLSGSYVDKHDYDRHREECLSKIMQTEGRFKKLAHQLHNARAAQYEKIQDSILNRRSDVFKRRQEILDAEFEAKRKNLSRAKELRLEALRRKLEAERIAANHNFEYEKSTLKQKISDEITSKFRDLTEEEHRVQERLYELFGPSELTPTSTSENSSDRNHNLWPLPAQQNCFKNRTKPSIEHYLDKEGRWQNVPVIIAQLPNQNIRSDLDVLGLS